MKKPTKKTANGTAGRKIVSARPAVKGAKKKKSAASASVSIQKKVTQEMSLLLNNTEESFVLVDTDFRIIIFNKQFQQLYKKYFGKEVKQGESILDYTQPQRRDIVRQIYLTVFTGEKLQSEIELLLPNGTLSTFVNKFKPAYNEEGKLMGAFVTCTDITEKKETERQISEERILLRTLIDNLPLNVYTKDLNSKKTLANRTDYEYAGFTSEEEILGKDDFELFSEESARNTIAEDQLIFTTGNSIIGKEEHHIKKDGSDIWFLISKIPLKNRDGEVIGLLGISYNIAERKEAQEKIRIAKERYDIVTKATNEAIWDWDMVTNLVNWGDGFRALFGYKTEEPITLEAWTHYIHPDDEKRVIASIMKTVNSSGTSKWEEEYQFRKINGSYAIVLDRGFVIRNAHGQPTRMIGAMQDITQRKKSEQFLRESEEKYRTLTERVSDAFIALDNDWNYTYVNTKAGELIKRDPAFLIGKNMWEVAPESIDQPFYQALHQARRTQQPAHLQLYYPPSGKWYEDYIYPTPDGITVYFREITEQKKAEEAMQKNKTQLSIASKLARLGYWELNIAEGEFTFNDHFYEILKTSVEEVGSYTMKAEDYSARFLHPDDRKVVKEEIIKALETTDPNYTRHMEHRILYPDGKIGHLAVRFFVVKDEQGQTIKTVGANQDITDRKELELQLNRRAEELAASNADLEQFAYVASHDLQEPLRMVSSFLQLLQKKYNNQLDETAIQYITYAVDGSDRMKQLIMDLLEYSRVGTNQDNRVKMDMGEIVRHVLDMFAGKINETKAVIRLQPMPAIKVNKSQITQLIQNLVGNALKYNTSPIPEIEIGCEEKQDVWEFRIKDNGIGIEPKFFEKVFVIFQRLHNKNQFSGTGIGLAICKKIVERHGGTIWIESAVGNGSTFLFTIRK